MSSTVSPLVSRVLQCRASPARPAAGRMPMEAGMGFQGSHGLWASWRYLGQALLLVLPGDVSTSVSLVIALWFSSALQGSGLPEGLPGAGPRGTQLHLLWGAEAAWEPCCAGQDKGSAQPPLPPAVPANTGQISLAGILPKKMVAIAISYVQHLGCTSRMKDYLSG